MAESVDGQAKWCAVFKVEHGHNFRALSALGLSHDRNCYKNAALLSIDRYLDNSINGAIWLVQTSPHDRSIMDKHLSNVVFISAYLLHVSFAVPPCMSLGDRSVRCCTAGPRSCDSYFVFSAHFVNWFRSSTYVDATPRAQSEDDANKSRTTTPYESGSRSQLPGEQAGSLRKTLDVYEAGRLGVLSRTNPE